ncbi:hypothetical protein, partial [Pseudomonas syringae]|uniref:hypothetical protein n=1 Tax=Pseudomonas syringae TaxID=317 RepID=UPI001C811223
TVAVTLCTAETAPRYRLRSGQIRPRYKELDPDKKPQAFAAEPSADLSSNCGLANGGLWNLPNAFRPLVTSRHRWDTTHLPHLFICLCILMDGDTSCSLSNASTLNFAP